MLWVTSFHIIAMTCWFSALFYLPRLFVYHAMSEDQISKDRFVIMERKLMRGIATPSMIATLILGLWLLHYIPSYIHAPWMHAKLTLVALTIGYHHMCGRYMKQLATGTSTHSHQFFRVFNEIPVIFLVGIVVLVWLNPFKRSTTGSIKTKKQTGSFVSFVGTVINNKKASVSPMPADNLSQNIFQDRATMDDSLYKLIFEGETLPGFKERKVRKNLNELLNPDKEKLKRLFSGKPIIIRKNLNASDIRHYEKAMMKAGAQCRIVAMTSDEELPPTPLETILEQDPNQLTNASRSSRTLQLLPRMGRVQFIASLWIVALLGICAWWIPEWLTPHYPSLESMHLTLSLITIACLLMLTMSVRRLHDIGYNG